MGPNGYARREGGAPTSGSCPSGFSVVDTTVLIAHLGGEPRASELLVATPRPERRMSVLSRVEVEGGMRPGERSAVARLMGAMESVPVSDQITFLAAQLLREYRRSHSGIDLVDYVIAATAKLHDEPLATLKIRHVPMFDGLTPAW